MKKYLTLSLFVSIAYFNFGQTQSKNLEHFRYAMKIHPAAVMYKTSFKIKELEPELLKNVYTSLYQKQSVYFINHFNLSQTIVVHYI
jgi:hypothetical protein